ncbi:hypothetical protein ACFYU9_19345 [Streptomyces sp. NPDC004327]
MRISGVGSGPDSERWTTGSGAAVCCGLAGRTGVDGAWDDGEVRDG